MIASLRRLLRPKLGIKDLLGKTIREKDTLLVFLQEYKEVSRDEKDTEIPVIEVDSSSPLPVADIPVAKGVCYWDASELRYMLKVTWLCPQWRSSGLACLSMGSNYSYGLAE